MTQLLPDPLLPDPQSRRQQIRRERRRTQRRITGALLGLAALLTLALTWYLATDEELGTAPAGTARTVLLQLQRGDDSALAGALLTHDPAGASGSVLLIGSPVVLDVPGAGPVTFGEALRTGPGQRSGDALAGQLGVSVDGGWVLNLPSLGRLVDLLGGVPVQVAAPVRIGRRVVVPAGPQQLDGDQVGYYLGFLRPGEPEQARLGRLRQVLDGVLGRLPDDPATGAGLLNQLGPRSVPSLPVDELAALLTALAEDDDLSRLNYDVLTS